MKINQAETQDKLYQATYQTEKEDIKRNGKQLQNNTVFAGNLNLMEDPKNKKREEKELENFKQKFSEDFLLKQNNE